MFSDIKFLIENREKAKTLRRWLLIWIKRAVQFLPLVKLLFRGAVLRWRGAEIGNMVVVGEAKIEGYPGKLSVGSETSLGQCQISLHESISIGFRVCINDGVRLLSASHSLSDPSWSHKRASIVIEDYAWVAMDAIILPGVRIGRGAVVGAGAVVRRNVPPFAVVIGNPAVETSTKRMHDLSYSPVRMNAPFEAWLGPSQS